MKRIALTLLPALMLLVLAACEALTPKIETTALPSGMVGIWYDFTLDSNGAPGA